MVILNQNCSFNKVKEVGGVAMAHGLSKLTNLVKLWLDFLATFFGDIAGAEVAKGVSNLIKLTYVSFYFS